MEDLKTEEGSLTATKILSGAESSLFHMKTVSQRPGRCWQRLLANRELMRFAEVDIQRLSVCKD